MQHKGEEPAASGAKRAAGSIASGAPDVRRARSWGETSLLASLAEGPTRDTPVEASDEAADQAADDSLGHANVVQETAGATEASVQPSKAG